MADAFSPQAVTASLLAKIQLDLFVKGYMGLGRVLEVLQLADVDCESPLAHGTAKCWSHNPATPPQPAELLTKRS